MPRMTLLQFTLDTMACSNRYDQHNQWFGFQTGGPSWSQGTWVDFIQAAWKLYVNASAIRNRIVVLGDTKIRSDPSLVFNFGLVSNSKTPQEEKDRLLILNLMEKRRNNQQGALGGNAPEEIMGKGSILSARRWSPMLNDALMIAGAENNLDFVFALNEDERIPWSKAREFDAKREKFGAAVRLNKDLTLAQEKWLNFIKKHPRILWENGNPRVFARELLGLKEFGYVADFNEAQIGFKSALNASKPMFQNYLSGLERAQFHMRNRQEILKKISEFLFNDDTLLRDVGR